VKQDNKARLSGSQGGFPAATERQKKTFSGVSVGRDPKRLFCGKPPFGVQGLWREVQAPSAAVPGAVCAVMVKRQGQSRQTGGLG